MPTIGPRCHELRIADHEQGKIWRIVYRLDSDAIVVADTFPKKTRSTPATAILRASRRLQRYDRGPDGGSQ
jgi:phage-related protein